jgi:antitoxin ParD1/3/4
MAKVAKKRYNHYRQRHFLESLHGNNEHIPSDPMRDWVESRSKQGAYGNHSDYVRDLIRKDQLQVQKLKTMQDAITKGLESGEAKAFDKEAFKKRLQDSL